MSNLFPRLIFGLLGIYACQVLYAQQFDSGNFRYTVLSSDDKTVGIAQSDYHLTGNVVLPSSVEFEGEVYTVTTLPKVAFAYCEDITSIEIPETVNCIGEYAFWECRGLEAIQVPASVDSLGLGAFWACSKLKQAKLPDGLKRISESLFYACSSLNSVTMGDNVEIIDPFAFKDCPNFDVAALPSSLKTIGEGAFVSTGVTNVVLPDGIVSVGPSAFSACAKLKEFHIPASLSELSGGVLASCPQLEKIVVAEDNACYSSLDGVLFNKDRSELIAYPNMRGSSYTAPATVKVVLERAFENCTSIKDVTFQKGVETIGKQLFWGCYELQSVVLPETVKTIGYGFLQDTNSMTSVECRAITPPECEDNCFYGMFLNDCLLTIPEGTKDAYASAREWRKFKNVAEKEYTSVDRIAEAVPVVRACENKLIFEGFGKATQVNVYDMAGAAVGSLVIAPTYDEVEIDAEGLVVVDCGSFSCKLVLD